MEAKDWRGYRAVSIAVAVSVGVLGGSGVAFAQDATGPDGPSPAVVTAQVNAAQSTAARVLADAAEVDRVGDFPSASTSARRAAADIERRLRVAMSSEDVQVRQAARTALVPALGLMEDVARLETVTPEALRTWSEVESDLERHASALAAAQTALLPGAQPATATAEAGEDAGEAVGKVVARAQRKLKAWRRSVRAFRRDRVRNREAAVNYSAGVRSLLAQYAGTRSELQALINNVEAYDATIAEGATASSRARRRRA